MQAAAARLAVVALAMHGAAAGPDPYHTTCRAVRGHIVPDCNAQICTQGSLTGDLSGHFTSKVTSIYPAGSGWLYSAWIRIELDERKGRIDALSEGSVPFDDKGGPDLAHGSEVVTVTEGDGVWQGHAGTMIIIGAHMVGQSAPYVGRLCRSLPTH